MLKNHNAIQLFNTHWDAAKDRRLSASRIFGMRLQRMPCWAMDTATVLKSEQSPCIFDLIDMASFLAPSALDLVCPANLTAFFVDL